MLTMLKSDDKAQIEYLCKESSVSFNDDTKAFVAQNRGEVCGYAIYHFAEGKCIIDAVDCMGDEPLFDGLVRSVFFSATENDIDLPAEFSKSIDATLLKKYNFVVDDTYFVKSMSDFLNNCKNCKN